MSIGADCLFAIGEGQDLFTQAAVLWKSLFVHFLEDMPDQHLGTQSGQHWSEQSSRLLKGGNVLRDIAVSE